MKTRGAPFRFGITELNGALGDAGTLLPLMLGVVSIGGLAPTPVLLSFAVAYVATGLVYRLPIPVQPMKAVAAVLLTQQIAPETVALTGVTIGLVLLTLGATGVIDRVAQIVPRSIITGLRLGLGCALGWLALQLMADEPWIGAISLGLTLALYLSRFPAVIAVLAVGLLIGLTFGVPSAGTAPSFPSAELDISTALTGLVLPQIALTLTNAVVLTALVAGDLFGPQAAHVTPRRLCLTSGLLNCVLSPFGALPMCHGAGGLAAHHGFGARSGAAPLLIGALLFLVALPVGPGIDLLARIPEATLGALLLVAALELARDRRIATSTPSCRAVIAVTALGTILFDPFIAMCAGTVAEIARRAMLKHCRRNEP